MGGLGFDYLMWEGLVLITGEIGGGGGGGAGKS